MLLASSCSKDGLETAQSGNEAQVTFSLGLEGHIATRAISDGKSADELVYAVFDENGTRITGISKIEKTNVTFPTTETLTLAKGQTYKVAFWAQDADCSAYTVDDNMNVEVSYGSAGNNDETRDAFFKTVTVEVTGSTSIDVELKRPFAQINVGVEMDDWTAAVASGVEIQNSSVVIKNAATKIDLVTGTVSEPTEVTYSLETIPTEDLEVDVDGDGEKETYKWLSMSYILVDDESEAEGVQGARKATLESLKFTFKPASGNEIILEDGLNSVPVQRNWRTNILGKLLTGDITFNISIDEMYEGDYNHVVVSSAQQLIDALADPEVTNIVLENDLTGTDVNIASTKEIDLNNNTLQVDYINVTAPLTVKNGNLNSSNYALRGYANADITLDNVKVTATNSDGNAIELGYINPKDKTDYDCGDAQLTLKDSEINAEGVGILIHGANNKVKIENTVINHKWFGITQNGTIPGSEIELINCTISGLYSGIYLSNNAVGTINKLNVTGGSIHSDEESAIEVKKTDITVQNVTLSSSATTQSYSVSGSGSNGIGYGIVLAGYSVGVAYEGDTSFENITYNLSAQGDNVVKILKYNGTEGEKVE